MVGSSNGVVLTSHSFDSLGGSRKIDGERARKITLYLLGILSILGGISLAIISYQCDLHLYKWALVSSASGIGIICVTCYFQKRQASFPLSVETKPRPLSEKKERENKPPAPPPLEKKKAPPPPKKKIASSKGLEKKSRGREVPAAAASETTLKAEELASHSMMEEMVRCIVEEPNEGFPLHCAAYRGDLEEVTRLLEQISPDECISLDEQNEEMRTALHLAAFGGHVEVCSLLLERGANLHACAFPKRRLQDQFNPGNFTPLHYAIFGRQEAVVDLFIRKKCYLNSPCSLSLYYEGVLYKFMSPLILAKVWGGGDSIVSKIAEGGGEEVIGDWLR